ncbi:hypothetical protein M413DRAFT_30274 [Hebeloma cylindrosporum]|uniref:Uncharacterized protein n=1 Tax=Hebeloma cylindrosporum TaxID=76867 RepID=A0A0C3BNB6_HEBCY|nr:hypothetical protein M413DRAFT_30274 [Hebeloma cylindrosporum h7]
MTTTPRPTADNSNGATSQSDVAKVRLYKIRTGQVFDPIERVMFARQVIWVDRDTGVVVRLGEEGETFRSEFEVEVTDVDLTKLTVLPGFVDVHVHLFLHPYAETSWDDQLTKESLAGRTIRATVHAKKTLLAGFTTVRRVWLDDEAELRGDLARL